MKYASERLNRAAAWRTIRAMGRPSLRNGLIVAIAAVLVTCASPAFSDEQAAVPNIAGGPAVVLAALANDPRTPDGYAAAVELHVKLHSFPFIGLTVHGNSTYQRPGQYHYQLQNLPRIAAKFDDLRYDLGDPTSWPVKYDITMAPQSTDAMPVLRLTPKHPGQVTMLDIETDAKHARMLKATWMRKDGGTIVLTQTYSAVGPDDVVTGQHAVIDIPYMRAELTATYTNVTLESATFAGLQER
jgi:hypothetical protein